MPPIEQSNFPGSAAEVAVFGGSPHTFSKQVHYFTSSLATTLLVEMVAQPGTTTRVFVTQGVNPHMVSQIHPDLASTGLYTGFY